MRLPDLSRLGTVRASAVVLATLTLLGVAAGLVVNLAQGPRWNASTNVLVRVASPDDILLTGNAYPISIADQIDASALATSQAVLLQAARVLGERGGLTAMQKHVAAAPQGSSHVIVIQATQPDPVTAQRYADVVAATYVSVTEQQLAAFAASLPPPAPGDTQGSEVLRRAQLITRTLQPLQVFHSDQPTRLSRVQAPVALGIVGLGAGVLVVLAMTFLGRRIDRSRDAQRLLTPPAVDYHQDGGGTAAKRLPATALPDVDRHHRHSVPVTVVTIHGRRPSPAPRTP